MKPTDLGPNRTGIKASPLDAPDVARFAHERVPHFRPDGAGMAQVRIELARAESRPLGTMPRPASVKGAVKAVAKLVQGKQATVLLDKLGERAGFERAGVRLYELALSKFDAYGSWRGGPGREDLLAMRSDELRHFGLVSDALEQLGGDRTALTPCADLASVLSMGIPAALADPRTDLLQGLQGLLVAELTDHASWALLITLARELGQDGLGARFEAALATEEQHLARVKTWLESGTLAAAQGMRPSSADEGQHPGA